MADRGRRRPHTVRNIDATVTPPSGRRDRLRDWGGLSQQRCALSPCPPAHPPPRSPSVAARTRPPRSARGRRTAAGRPPAAVGMWPRTRALRRRPARPAVLAPPARSRRGGRHPPTVVGLCATADTRGAGAAAALQRGRGRRPHGGAVGGTGRWSAALVGVPRSGGQGGFGSVPLGRVSAQAAARTRPPHPGGRSERRGGWDSGRPRRGSSDATVAPRPPGRGGAAHTRPRPPR